MISDCIIWQGALWAQGRYGMDVINGCSMGAHRAAWIRKFGEIPKGLLVCHKCDNGLCVNPDHLFLGTHQDNMEDGKSKGRFRAPSNQKGQNNFNARPDYIQVRQKARELRRIGWTYSDIKKELRIKSNGHLRNLIK